MSNSVYLKPEQIKFKFNKKQERFNPRTIYNEGFSEAKISKLKRQISKDGLNCPLITVKNGNYFELIAGERRLRSIQGLIDLDKEALDNGTERVLVKNQKNGKMEPALKVYQEQGIECKISDATDDKELKRQAIQDNTNHEGLTDYEILLQCGEMEDEGFSRAEQAEILDVSQAWLSQSHTLLNGPKCILDAMSKGVLPRTAAVTFIDVDLERVEDVLKRAIQQTYAAAKEKLNEAEDKVAEAVEEHDKAKREEKLAMFTGNKQSKERATRQVARSGKNLNKAEKELEKVKEKVSNPVIPVEAVTKEAKEIGATDKAKPHLMKITRQFEEEIAEMLDKSPKEIKTNKGKVNKRDALIVLETLRWQLNKNGAEHPLDAVFAVK